MGNLPLISFLFLELMMPNFLMAASPSSSDRIRVSSVKGSSFAYVMRAFPQQKGLEEKLGIGSEILVGDELRTPDKTVVQLTQWDGSTYFVGPNSQLKLVARTPDKQNFDSWVFNLAKGAVHGLVESEDPAKEVIKLRVKSRLAAMGVRGTDFLVSSTPDSMKVFTRKGEVIFGRSDKFASGTYVSVKEKMFAEAGKELDKPVSPPKEDPEAFPDALKNAGLMDIAINESEGKQTTKIQDCYNMGLAWRVIPGKEPMGECY